MYFYIKIKAKNKITDQGVKTLVQRKWNTIEELYLGILHFLSKLIMILLY